MFDKNKFAQILKNINNTYNSQRDFAKKSEINRTYLSQYMNMKLDEPPKPKILEKLANNSNGIISYQELMEICGYIDTCLKHNFLPLYEELNDLENNFNKTEKLLNNKEYMIQHNLFTQLLKYVHDDHTTPKNFNPNELLNDLDFVSISSKQKLYNSLQAQFLYYYKMNEISKKLYASRKEQLNNSQINSANYLLEKNRPPKIPILGTVKSGYNWLAEENIIGYITDKDTIKNYEKNIDEYFALKVTRSINVTAS